VREDCKEKSGMAVKSLKMNIRKMKVMFVNFV